VGLLRTVRQRASGLSIFRGPEADPHDRSANLRVCSVEELESRRAMAVAPLHFGSVYYEEASGDDSAPDILEVSYAGGVAGTQLAKLTIDGDKLQDGGLTLGDVFWDTAAGGRGVFGSVPMAIVSHTGFTISNVSVADGSSLITFDIIGWDAGEKLVFSLDVDEQGLFSSTAVAEGGEFEGSILTGYFSNPHYEDITGSAIYFDFYDQNFASAQTQAGSALNLPQDDYTPPDTIVREDRTAGAVVVVTQVAKPITLAGTVYHDKNQSVGQDGGEEGIAGVNLTLLQWNGSDYVSTGKTAVTNANGEYKFSGLLPAKYRVVETQPVGWLSTGAKPGTVNGGTRGAVVTVDILGEIPLDGGEDSIRNDFGEVLPASLRGRVHADPEGDCLIGPNDVLLTNVKIDLLDATGTVIASTLTNGAGEYEFAGLRPGVYGVRETQPVGYFQGDTHAGTVGGAVNGDLISMITLNSGAAGLDYNFCELFPAKLSGYVWADPQGDGVKSATDIAIGGVTVELYDANGQLLKSAQTNSTGFYEFTELAPGTYRVKEVQPAGYYQGGQLVGTVGGAVLGADSLGQIVLAANANGQRYDFYEVLPASLGGRVWADPQGDCVLGPNDIPLSGVTVELLDANDQLVTTTTTNAFGEYLFTNLAPGTYNVRETQPTGYYQGMEMLGSVGGVVLGTDHLGQIVLGSGANAVQYDFCEELPAKISGKVFADRDGDCLLDPEDIVLAGVKIELFNVNGTVIATTFSKADGTYEFTNLAPKQQYAVQETQPAGYYQGSELIGTAGGLIVATDRIGKISLTSGEHGRNYDFCEEIPVGIRGRVHADPEADCIIGPNDILLANVKIELLDANGQVIQTAFSNSLGEYAFEGLPPGVYSVRETQPTGYFQGDANAGSKGGVVQGTDLITQIVLPSGELSVENNFCELLPGKLSGKVWADPQNDAVFANGDVPLAGVAVQLCDVNGKVLQTTFTNAQGEYEFTNLAPGTYGVRELQPSGYFQGGQLVGSAGGIIPNADAIKQIIIGSGTSAIRYDFYELLPAALTGRVWSDPDMGCVFNEGDAPLAGVTIELLDGNGIVISAKLTDDNGFYRFEGLEPGKLYAVRERQPNGYSQGGTLVGSSGGAVLQDDLIGQITLDSNEFANNYDFCEIPTSALSGYVFQDGPAITLLPGQSNDVYGIRKGIRGADSIAIPGVKLLLGNQNGLPIYDSNGQPRIATTNAAGYYEFANLMPGFYTVREIQPNGYFDNIDKAGSTSGFAFNRNANIPLFVLAELQVAAGEDFIARINVPVGVSSVENNFSEVAAVKFLPPPDVLKIPPPPTYEFKPGLPPAVNKLTPFIQAAVIARLYIDGTGARGNTWHLSVIDAGMPRTEREQEPEIAFASQLNLQTWNGVQMDQTQWTLLRRDGRIVATPIFGNTQGLPVPGDYNGDGKSELGVFINGEWFIDINDNGQWDKDDLWAKLGTADDLPVVGDWDGDGKDDIGIYGPAWPRDPQAIQREPGLPITLNPPSGKAKNMPPLPADAPLGERTLKRALTGKLRADLIDHVFHYGANGDQPVAGDWTGQGSDSIGVFRAGVWRLDVDGNGEWSSGDIAAEFGGPGDKAVVGDWNGDGVEELGVYRAGKFILDTNGNRELDAADTVVELPPGTDPAGTPVAADWDGDGRDEVGLHHNTQSVKVNPTR